MVREYTLHPFKSAVELQVDYAGELNDQQRAPVLALPGPSLVIAGAGSGKTRTLTYRVAYLLEQGIPPDRILLLTFTNKAAAEMMRRVSTVLGRDLIDLWGGTFHSIGHRILRRHADVLGYRRDFTIMDSEDAKDLLHACLGGASIDPTERRFPKAEVLGEIFSFAVNTGRSIEEVLEADYGDFVELAEEIKGLQLAFAARKQAANMMDFDDLLVLWLRLLRDAESVRELLQRRFQFVLVDEYQDTNLLQSEIIDLMVARHHNVMVVGDDAQSIYSWRGANFRNIFEFPKRYPDAQVYRVEVNYRSTPEILALANAVIAGNVHQFEKRLEATRRSGTRPWYVISADPQQQAGFLAQRLLELRDEGIALNEIAVLYRSHFNALDLQLELTKRNIPYSITSGLRFFEQAHMKDVAAFLKWMVNPRDEVAFKRIVRLLPGIGTKAAEKLWNCFLQEWGRQSEGAQRAAALEACRPSVPKKSATAWAQLTATIDQLEREGIMGDATGMIRLIVEAIYEEYLIENYTNHRARLDELEQLAAHGRQYSTLEDFLGNLALMTNLEAREDRAKPTDEEQVRLSTVHQAKGLEFRVVFVIMLSDGNFPTARSLDDEEAIEEERRLFYVAVTRAKDELYLTYPMTRLSRDGSYSIQQPSRFVSELPRELMEECRLTGFG